MIKRITSFLLAVVMVLGVMSAGTFKVSAESALIASDECIRVLKEEEGFSLHPYWDYTQWTVGFGTRCPDDMLSYYQANGITEPEAEVLLRNHLAAIELDLNTRIVDGYGLALTQNQFDALVLFSYNCGTGWTYDNDGTVNKALKSGATGNGIIRALALWCNAGGQIKDYLLRRRLSESNMYLNGVYSRTPPENYGYVLYNANGGSVTPRSQGYDYNEPVAPYPVPTYSGYTFAGWFTDWEGGTQVTTLDASTKGMTLYAHWVDANGNPPAKEVISVLVTVNTDGVNLRKGPGTNYTIVGKANTGDQMTITETTTMGGLRWGKYDGGWICLQYTNFDTASQAPATPETTPPETTPPETTPPETTAPETTVPETTVPETTVPETTAPETTVPETTAPPTTAAPETTAPEATQPAPAPSTSVMGTVKVDSELNVRSGPSTGYSKVGTLSNGTRVEILAQQTTGSMVWGQITNGWISLDYVVLDSTSSGATSTPDSSFVAKWTGKVVNCDRLRLRSGPGTSYSCIGYIQAGEAVAISEKQNNGSMVWGKVSNGWISLDYVALDSDSSNSGGESVALTGVVTAEEFLRIRTGPGTSYAVAGYLNPADVVQITERRYNGSTPWGKIDRGWISMDYIRLTDGSADTSAGTSGTAKTVIASCLNVRSDAGTNNPVVHYYYYGTKVEITETKDVNGTAWGKTNMGWICMDYVQ